MSQQQQVFSGRYEMVRHLARGGMAQVYLARDLLLDRPVALKVLFPELSVDPSFVERFRREAQAAANLIHPNIVSIFDWGQGERTYFIVMEMVDGHTLSSVIRQGPLDASRAASIGADVAGALDFAHRHGVIHRDVKPGNVLIDTSGQVKVTDFGIARAIGAAEGLTQTGAVMGTATYFSPEQAQGHPVDARSDVYSLGVMLYEMVVGHPPFTGDNPVSIAYKHVREAAVPANVANPAVPASFAAVVGKAMAKDPAERYQTAQELRADLVRYQQGQPVFATTAPTAVVAGIDGAGATRVQPRAEATSVLTPTGQPPVGPPPDERPSRAGWWAAAVVLLLLALAAGLFFLGRSLGWWSLGSTKSATIPTNVVGKTSAAAKGELHGLGFTTVQTRAQASDSVKADHVITTTPAPGTHLPVNRAVTLIVSSGPAPVKVPNVVGQSQQAATAALRQAGFVVNASSQASDTVADGLVISQDPPGNQSAPKGSAVTLVVSSGKKQVTIPSLVGQPPGAAGQRLGSLGLNVTQQNEASTSVPSGEVTRTDPPAGTSVPVGTTVTIFVSTGPQQVQVPSLQGDTQSAAQAALQAKGLKGNFTTQPTTDPTQVGKVISQDPSGGSSVNTGSTVNVVIGAAAPTSSSTPTSGSSGSNPAGGQ